MSTKASPPTSSATASTNVAATTSAGGVIKIKSELLPSDEIKEYAENTMNELLGWYGFDGVDRLDLSSKNSRLLQSSNVANTSVSHHHHHHQIEHQMEKRRSRNRPTTLLNLQQQNLRSNNNNNNNNNKNNINSNNSNSNNSNSNNNNNTNSNYSNSRNSSSKNHSNSILNNHNSNNKTVLGQGTTGCGGNESTTSDHDTRSSREEDSKSPHSAGKTTIDEKIDYDNCCWCRRPVPENAPEFLTTSDGPRYCSESCFTQSRRASFKKAKTCDWCKHVRHAVSYVDFQDGASQLQFCSDKCLNQYKMQIFCKETQAHLDMNPHLRDQGLEAAAAGNSAGLITPDLWLRNCRSRSASPASTLSISPVPSALTTISASMSRLSPPLLPHTAEHRPLISVAPVSKLMSKSPVNMSRRQSPKHSRKKRVSRSNQASAEGDCSLLKLNHGNLRRELNNLGPICPSQHVTNTKSLLSVNKANSLRTSPGQVSTANTSSSSSSVKLPPTTLGPFTGSNITELHMSVPQLSPMLEHQPPTQQHQHAVLAAHPGVGGRGSSIAPAFFAGPPGAPAQSGLPHQPPPLMPGFSTRPPFMQSAALGGGLPRFMNCAAFPPMQQPLPFMQPDAGGFASLLGAPPPVTVMVPYPIIIPLPIPIPIPLPVIDFYRAYLTPEQREELKKKEEKQKADRLLKTMQNVESSNAEESLSADNQTAEAPNEPLDFTKSKQSPASNMQSFPEESEASPKDSAAYSDHFINQSRSYANTPTENTQNLPPTESQASHSLVTAPEAALEENNTPQTPAPSHETEDPQLSDCDDAKEKLPKFKITRLHTKRTLIQTKESECSRPLRKRKRIIDCDFQKIALNNKDAEQDEENDSVAENNSMAKNSSRK